MSSLVKELKSGGLKEFGGGGGGGVALSCPALQHVYRNGLIVVASFVSLLDAFAGAPEEESVPKEESVSKEESVPKVISNNIASVAKGKHVSVDFIFAFCPFIFCIVLLSRPV